MKHSGILLRVSEKLPSNSIPLRAELEKRFGTKIVTYQSSDGAELPGGQCGCCGSGPNPQPDWRGDPWYVYKAGICDSDGVYYSMLCEGCLEEIREDNDGRPKTLQDELAAEMTALLGDDLDGAQVMMEELPAFLEAIMEETETRVAHLQLGQIVMTPGVAANTTEQDRFTALQRHESGDWGDVPREDAAQNEWAQKNDARVLSSYLSSTRVRFWIITEADRSATTLLLPEEY